MYQRGHLGSLLDMMVCYIQDTCVKCVEHTIMEVFTNWLGKGVYHVKMYQFM